MKIPRSIKIQAHKIEIRVVKTIKEFTDVLGYANLTQNLIVMRTHYNGEKLKESTRAEVFMHEILHEVAELNAIKLTEQQIKQLGGGLLQVIRDNKLNFLDKTEA